MSHIDKLKFSNPKQFWEELNRLGSVKSSQIPMEVYGTENTIVYNQVQVLTQWEGEFECCIIIHQ